MPGPASHDLAFSGIRSLAEDPSAVYHLTPSDHRPHLLAHLNDVSVLESRLYLLLLYEGQPFCFNHRVY
jgi:hypothetical protein